MAIIGPDGNDAPALTDGVPTRVWLAVQGRALTYWEREPFDREYGLGLVDGLRNPGPSLEGWQTRMRDSFALLDGYDAFAFEVALRGTALTLGVELRPDGN